jgi:intracellular sulfur oxidation DsrE/DsrF family protein
MNKDELFSEEQLNAFVDDELEPEEKARVFSEARQQPELEKRLCQQRNTKELVKLAYEDVPTPRRKGAKSLGRGNLFGRALAASILVAFGMAAGFLAKTTLDQAADPTMVAATEPSKYLLHVASGDPVELAAALERAEFLLESASDDGIRQVEIVANEQGLNLLRSDVTQFAAEISVLQANDVVFYACSKTIQKLEDDGVEVRLVPHTIAEYTALDRVVTRMQEGWHYEKI